MRINWQLITRGQAIYLYETEEIAKIHERRLSLKLMLRISIIFSSIKRTAFTKDNQSRDKKKESYRTIFFLLIFK